MWCSPAWDVQPHVQTLNHGPQPGGHWTPHAAAATLGLPGGLAIAAHCGHLLGERRRHWVVSIVRPCELLQGRQPVA